MKKSIIFLTLLIFNQAADCQIFTQSNLPIVVINTDDDIPDEPKIEATMGIIDNGLGFINFLSDDFNNYDGNIGIDNAR